MLALYEIYLKRKQQAQFFMIVAVKCVDTFYYCYCL